MEFYKDTKPNVTSFKMRSLVFCLLLTFVTAAVVRRGDDWQPRICPELPVKGGGCIRCTPPGNVTNLDVRGFDVTGVTTEIDLKFPQIDSLCDCIEACLDRNVTCNNFVWKFSDAESVESGHRTCTLCTFPSYFAE